MQKDKPQSSLAEIIAGIGSVDDIEIYNNQVLVGVYMRPGVTPGGIILTDKTNDEDKWQGKVAVVLKKGPLAFKDAPGVDFAGQDVNVGDWVMYRISDGFPFDLNGVHCRLLGDTEIRMRVASPNIIY